MDLEVAQGPFPPSSLPYTHYRKKPYHVGIVQILFPREKRFIEVPGPNSSVIYIYTVLLILVRLHKYKWEKNLMHW